MNGGDGFIDLRLNRQEGQAGEGFWPSFTDIMTVIVMIFLIAMVVLLMRNMELVNQLRATMEAERVAAELARATGQEKETLAVRLHSAEEHVAQLQLQLMRQQEQNVDQESVITRQLGELADLTAERDALNQKNSQLTLARQRLETELDTTRLRAVTAEQNIVGLNQNLASLQSRFDQNQEQLAELQQTVAQQQSTLEQIQNQRQSAERKYLLLVGEYDELKVKYDKLVRPARSPQGRHLVEVRYWKSKGEYKITWRPSESAPSRAVNRTELEKELDKLLAANANGLYVKVIIPEDSGLSYNEAWEFTSHFHKKYDYYFKEEKGEQE